MKKLSSNEIRHMFLDFFESKGHLIVPSSSLIPKDDPSLLWINAGVAPLKKFFDGSKEPPSKRLVNSQKCIRTNDIESVGDTYHHTFFEMLGNFSIGNYFMNEALEYAWELLTSPTYFGIDKDKLYVTVYPDDKNTYNKWLDLGLDKSHIILCNGNFWDIGPGPCGPDSEIFFDRGCEYDKRGPELIRDEIDNDRYIEIWNNVFSQFNHIEGVDRKDFPELPHKNIDTGMGLERLVCVLQNCKTNYDTDLFMPIIKKVEELSNVKYTNQKEIRSITDHIRALTFSLADGANFSNESRGYVLRRILRRASRFGKKLGINEPFMYKLTDSVIDIMKDFYPYLLEHKEFIDKQIKKEEEAFLKTLSSGEKRLEELVNSGKEITGSDVFKLYDTYGFPYELTLEILNEKNIKINKKDFDKCMQHQKQMAREASKKVSGMNTQGDIINFKEKSLFIGYDVLKISAKVIFTSNLDGNVTDINSTGIVITDKTPFYATMGGQVSDIGVITGNNLKAEVLKCEKAPNGQNMHFIRIIDGSIKVGDKVLLTVNKNNRFSTCQNHSATHLLQYSLRKVLGSEVCQAGSYVDCNTLRFDFKYTGKVLDSDIIKVEEKVNSMIKECLPANIKEMNIDDAIKLGAMALFDEKYGDKVRVVKFGNSIELCGGTHVINTKDINSFAIKSIESKGLNVYRIEAVCDEKIETQMKSMIESLINENKELLKKANLILDEASLNNISLTFENKTINERPICYKDILDNKNILDALRKNVSILDKKYKEKLTNKLLKNIDNYISKKESGKYGDVVILSFNDYDFNSLKSLTGSIEAKLNNGIVFISNVKSDSINFVMKASNNLKDNIDCGKIIKEISSIVLGSGGGSKTFAQGGGVLPQKKDEIEQYLKNVI